MTTPNDVTKTTPLVETTPTRARDQGPVPSLWTRARTQRGPSTKSSSAASTGSACGRRPRRPRRRRPRHSSWGTSSRCTPTTTSLGCSGGLRATPRRRSSLRTPCSAASRRAARPTASSSRATFDERAACSTTTVRPRRTRAGSSSLQSQMPARRGDRGTDADLRAPSPSRRRPSAWRRASRNCASRGAKATSRSARSRDANQLLLMGALLLLLLPSATSCCDSRNR
mmetsp:Transcript_17947/g.71933  ORF Transcript_17947/g.71933 Transcript_17947/m.71933 type:complete len:227 (-) Transcript_17947:1299-1979(-)